MSRFGRLRWTPALIIPLAILWLLMQGYLRDPSMGTATFHFFVVSLASSLSLLLALFILVAARQVRDAKVLFLGLTFYAMAGIFLIHALTTPGALVQQYNIWVGLSARLSLLAGAFFLVLSSIEWRQSQSQAILKRWGFIVVGVTAVIALYGYVALSDSTDASSESATALTSASTPVTTSPVAGQSLDYDDVLGSSAFALGITALTLGILAWVALRQGILYRRTGRPLHGGFFAATAL